MASQRVVQLYDDLIARLREFIVANHVTYEEFGAAVNFLQEVAQEEEIPLLLAVTLESTVEGVAFWGRPGSVGAIEGPYYIPGAPVLERPYTLPIRGEEPGDPVFLSGMVRSADGHPLAGALIDMWHADANGFYSNIPYPGGMESGVPAFNLRGRLVTDEKGLFEVRTIVPSAYHIPNWGPTGKLLEEYLGRHSWRPAHFHLKVRADGHQPLTSQLYFEGDEWLDSDCAGAVKPGLVLHLEKHSDPEEIQARGLDRAFFTTSYDFELAPA